MKIRTDFVTNSSSSSFIVSITINLKNKKRLSWRSNWYNSEDNGEIFINKSPREMAFCETPIDLAELLKQAVFTYGNRPFFKSNSRFIKDVQALPSMDDIETIVISGDEDYHYNNYIHNREYKYNLPTGEYLMKLEGECVESEGTGGTLIIRDYLNATVAAGSHTGCTLTISLTSNAKKTAKYQITGSSETKYHKESVSSIEVLHSPEDYKVCKTIEELRKMLDETLLADGQKVVLSKSLIDDTPVVKTMEDVDTIAFELKEWVWGDQDQGNNRITTIEGTTTYEYSFNNKKSNSRTVGFQFDHSKNALLYLVFLPVEKPKAVKPQKQASVSDDPFERFRNMVHGKK